MNPNFQRLGALGSEPLIGLFGLGRRMVRRMCARSIPAASIKGRMEGMVMLSRYQRKSSSYLSLC